MPFDLTAIGEEFMPDPQLEKRGRRRFSAEQKRHILDAVDACSPRPALGSQSTMSVGLAHQQDGHRHGRGVPEPTLLLDL